MIYLDFNSIYSVFEISIILLISSFALFIPLFYYYKNYQTALKLTIPTSISIQIIFAYFFYIFDVVKIYPICYLVIILAVNAWTIYQMKLFSKLVKLKYHKKFLNPILVALLLTMPIIYTRFYDSVINIAPGTIDTFSHIKYFFDLKTLGHLSYAPYPVGFHLFLYPSTIFVPISEMYRFTGPVLGLIIFLCIYLLFEDTFKNRLSKYLLILLFVCPVFSQLFLQTIGFFPTALTFIFLPFFVFLIAQPKEVTKKQSYLLYFLSTAALSLTVPYFYAQYLPALLLTLIVIFVLKKSFHISYFPYITKLLLITFLGVLIALGHFYIQAEIFKRDNKLVLIENLSDQNINQINYDKNRIMNQKITNFFKTVSFSKFIPSNFIGSYLSPIIVSAKSTLSIKNGSSWNNFLSTGAYSWLLLAIFICITAIKQKNKLMLIIPVFSIIFGLIITTGMFEMLNYSGRSSWYLKLLTLLATVYLFDILYVKTFKKYLWILLIVLYICALAVPPTFYRAYYVEPFNVAYQIKKQFPNYKIQFMSHESQLKMVSENFTVMPLNEKSIISGCLADKCFVVLNNKSFNFDVAASQQVLITDKGAVEDFCNEQKIIQNQHQEVITKITALPEFSRFKIYWENENITVYEFNQ